MGAEELSFPSRFGGRRRTRVRVWWAAVVVAAAGVVVGNPVASAEAPVAGGTFTVQVKNSGKCMDVPYGEPIDELGVQQWRCHTGAMQQWTLRDAGSGLFTLLNVASGKCLDIPYGATTMFLRAQQYRCWDGQMQKWRLTPSGSGTYQVVNAQSGLCLSNKDAGKDDGVPVVQETCTANSNKQWLFTPVGATAQATVAADGSGRYRTVQAALDALPANSVITVKPGTYRELVNVTKAGITLRGLGSAPAQVLIVNNRPASQWGNAGSATATFKGKDLTVENLTLSNDYDESNGGSQALAVNLESDRAVFRNVRFLGDQDTLLVNDSARAYVVASYIEGTVDFVFGGGTIVFDRTTVHEKRSTGGPITAASTNAAKKYGFLFYRCTVTGTGTGVTTLGRPWRQDGQVLFRESTLTATLRNSQPWTDMGDATWQRARFHEYENTGPGAGTNANRPQLPDSQAADFTPQRYLAGGDGWNPVG